MKRIRGKDTTPELRVRSYLHCQGLRFRLHVRDLPGKPDIVLRKYKTVVFVHGCFWHQHHDSACKRSSVPKSNQVYWLPKLKKTVERDSEHQKLLIALGWNVEIIWECQISKEGLERLKEGIISHV
ncbi:MAG: DNA mismatch endonuclease Vsr [Desulfobulbaceae bacterium]|nr:DNA mismatch endonuclease Vsr [Desulfobulbaceae bacterium]